MRSPAPPIVPEDLRRGAVLPDLRVLTRRERDVFALLGRGLTVLLLANQLEMSPHTARVHVTRIMKKLDLRDRSALMHCAVSSLIGR